MIHYLLCVDDTDDLSKKTSTGKIASLMGEAAQNLGHQIEFGITRHQLLIHQDIAYTSHNSAMCFAAATNCNQLDDLWDLSVALLKSEMAETSDPGLCLCRLDTLAHPKILLNFGKSAQKKVLTKKDAYKTAQAAGGIRLQEFGGTGIGVIGALAGVGLRLSGSDGTLRGKTGIGAIGVTLEADQMSKALGVSKIITKNGTPLDPYTPVFIADYAKLLLVNHELVAAAQVDEQGLYQICRKPQLYDGGTKNKDWVYGCEHFQSDNDIEECLDHTKVCCNCLFRRWTTKGYDCQNATKQHEILNV